MTAIPSGVENWARLSGPAAVLDAVHTRARRGHRTESGTLTTLVLTGEQRPEVGLLLGSRWELSGKPVRLQDLAEKLAEHHLIALGLVEVLRGGQVEPDRSQRDRAQAAAEIERQHVVAQLIQAGLAVHAVEQWLADTGLPRPGSGELQTLAELVATVLTRLRTTDSGTRLAQLAADVIHDAHALDSDRQLGRGVVRLLAVVHGLPRPQRGGRAWRATWAAAGVVCDDVSSRVLALSLPLTSDSPAARRLCADASGEPVWLTLCSLAGTWTTPAVEVFVCENPIVAEAAADTSGPACPPLVCTDGIASGTALDLLAGLVAA
ncbi:MAG: TIGR02679 domain-containing protein, partial [Umezawaea sp.]